MADLRDLLRRSEVTVAPDRDFVTRLRERCHEELFAPDTGRVAGHSGPEENEPMAVDLVDAPRRVPREPDTAPPSLRRNQRRIAVAAVAAIALVIALAVAVAGRDNGVDTIAPTQTSPSPTTPTTVPPLPDGLTLLPREGAARSTPETGQLLSTLAVPLWVYEDGRVISAHWDSHEDWNGFLEQRLSPSGVELVRAEIVALEPLEDCHTSGGFYGYADGSRNVCEYPGATNLYPPSPQYQRLSELPYGAVSWLPASAWTDAQPKPYVPSTYQVQINTRAGDDEEPPVDAAAMLAGLRPDVVSLLTRPESCPFPSFGPNTVCFNVPTEDARHIAEPLKSMYGEDEFGIDGGVWEEYWFAFLPYLPHQAPVWCCGG